MHCLLDTRILQDDKKPHHLLTFKRDDGTFLLTL
jgi:hypothetical protein